MAYNKLNDLSGKEWIKFTKSWFTISARIRTKGEIQHPAKYPEELVAEFVNFFTKEGQMVLDPFVGVGSTIIGCQNSFRKCIGIELNPIFAQETLKIVNPMYSQLLQGDCREQLTHIQDESIDFIMTSPPYWDMLKKTRGHSNSQHKERAVKELPLYYSDDVRDLGNITEYDDFLQQLTNIFLQCVHKLKQGKYMCIVVQNFRNTDGAFITLAWDIVRELSQRLTFCGEKIWLQENKTLGIWGYPNKFIPNIHHHYCLIFQKV